MAIKIAAIKPKHSNTATNVPNSTATDDNNNSSGSRSPSPPTSPPSSLLPRHYRRRGRPKLYSSQSSRKFSLAAGGLIFRGNVRYYVVLTLLYVSGFLMCVGPFSGFVGHSSIPGSVYRSHELFEKLWGDIERENSTSAIQLSSVWQYKRRIKPQKPCPNTTTTQRFLVDTVSPGPHGYLIVGANGGLNQQRSAICNAVAVAGLLNAILVIPRLEFNKVWKDTSEFGDIYDVKRFISTLEGYVKVVDKLPDELMERYDRNINNIPIFNVEAWAPANYYLGQVYPVLQKEGVIRITPFANRLAMNLPANIQLLRCITNYKALQFSSPISTLAQKLVDRMIAKSSRTGGKYVSVHLRFEEDMVAFSGCVYDGGEKEKSEMDVFRKNEWKGKFKRKDRLITPGVNRANGKCPLTPLEVGMMLRAMGFDNNTSIYLASGKIYRAEKHLEPLLKMFPLVYTKDSLATHEELSPFELYSSRMAALDYTVCLYSEVFVTTQGGNFPHFLMGHRRFLFNGHSKTIRPDKQKLVLVLQEMGISWRDLKDQMGEMLTESDRKGMMIPRVRKINRKTSIYMYPLPECSCLQNSTLEIDQYRKLS
ncbi:LOW QUALITY PROTEIN: O-fucosyltransferase 10-like [Rutidosis leptorrhynchoides]|uniref:LOW QUALITY PROTEIN: O-fucosyltransferase 10-like n=1 Tax=Rutidosis leptorrhynchoides TaxID=125765 RepID=UPI003A99DA1F